jgi:hypothetical protein
LHGHGCARNGAAQIVGDYTEQDAGAGLGVDGGWQEQDKNARKMRASPPERLRH